MQLDQHLDSYSAIIDGKQYINSTLEQLLKSGISQAQITALIQERALQKVIMFATQLRATAAQQADPFQVASWADKAQRAMRVISDNANSTDLEVLQLEANTRNKQESATELATLQLLKAKRLASAVAIIDGMISRISSEIKSKQSVDELNQLLSLQQVSTEQALTALNS